MKFFLYSNVKRCDTNKTTLWSTPLFCCMTVIIIIMNIIMACYLSLLGMHVLYAFSASKRQCSTNSIGIVRFKLKLWINFNRPAIKKIGRTYALQVGSLGSQAQCSMLFLFLFYFFFFKIYLYTYIYQRVIDKIYWTGAAKNSQETRARGRRGVKKNETIFI